MEDDAETETLKKVEDSKQTSSKKESPKTVPNQPRRCPVGRRSLREKKRVPIEKRRGFGEKWHGQKRRRQGPEEKVEGVTVKRTRSGGKRRWDKKHFCVFCHRPQVKIARHLLRKHADEQEVLAASSLPKGSKQRHLLLEHLRCRGNYLHNIEVIQQGSGEIVPWRQPSEEIDARNYLPCPLCLGFFLRADLWKHQVSCRKKLAIDPSQGPASKAEFPFKNSTLLVDIPSTGHSSMVEALRPPNPETSGSVGKSSNELAENHPEDPFRQTSNQSSEPGTNQTLTSAPGMDQNQNIDSALNQPKKRTRVQAAASRLLPISSGASESCSKILHRMNQDNVSYEVKSDWLICKYGNQLIGNQDGGHRKYDYFSQKLRELGRLLLAAKSLNSGIQTLQDLLTPGHLSLVLSAAQKAAGYRWSRPPLSVKATLKTVCEIAIEENLQDGDWEAAAKTTKFYDILGREWDSLDLQNSGPDPAAPDEGTKPKKKVVQSTSEPREPRSDVLPQNSNTPEIFPISPESRLQTPVPGPAPPRKVPRRAWSSSEKEAIWRQLGDHVLVQSVPGKEVCQRCLDLEPVLRGRHWKDVKNQVHNQIQSQKKQQFHAQMELEENQNHQNQVLTHQTQMDHQSKEPSQNQKKPSYQAQMDLNHQDSSQNPKRPQYQVLVDHQVQDSVQNQNKEHEARLLLHKKQLYQTRPDHQDQSQVQKKQLYQLDQQNHPLHLLDRDTSMLSVSAYRPDPGPSLLDREPYPVLHRPPGSHMDPLLSRTDWSDGTLPQNYPLSRPLVQNHLQEVLPGGPPPDPHSGQIHF